MESYNRCEERVCAKEEKIISVVKREETHEFIDEQLRKEYIKSSKLPQTALVFFVRKKDGKKHKVKDYMYSNK